MVNIILRWPFQVKFWILDPAAENIVSSIVFRLLLPMTNEAPTNEEDPPSHTTRQEMVVFMGIYHRT